MRKFRTPMGFEATISFEDIHGQDKVYISLGDPKESDDGVIHVDTFDVLDEDIFCYVKWEDVPFLFDGSEGWTLLSIDEMVFVYEGNEG